MNLFLVLLFNLLFALHSIAYERESQDGQLKSNLNSVDGKQTVAKQPNWRRNSIRFRKRNEILPQTTGILDYPDSTDEDAFRGVRDPAKNNYHIRFGRGDSNFIRYGRTSGEKQVPKPKGNKLTKNFPFVRFRRGGNDFIRFGRSGGYLEERQDEKRGNSNFLRFGRRSDQEDDGESLNEEEEYADDPMVREALFWRLLAEERGKLDDGNYAEESE